MTTKTRRQYTTITKEQLTRYRELLAGKVSIKNAIKQVQQEFNLTQPHLRQTLYLRLRKEPDTKGNGHIQPAPTFDAFFHKIVSEMARLPEYKEAITKVTMLEQTIAQLQETKAQLEKDLLKLATVRTEKENQEAEWQLALQQGEIHTSGKPPSCNLISGLGPGENPRLHNIYVATLLSLALTIPLQLTIIPRNDTRHNITCDFESWYDTMLHIPLYK